MHRFNKLRIISHEFIRSFSSSVSKDKCSYDVVVVGGGIVGVASALEIISQRPELTVAIVEKENCLAAHQSGHNSGVVHAGIYYKPGSLRAQLCTEGMVLAYNYFDSHSIPYKKVGKLIVATNPSQLPALDLLYQRGLENGVPDLKMLSAEQIKSIEPHCTGFKAIHSPHTGIVDWEKVTHHYGSNFESKNGQIYLNFKIVKFENSKESSNDNQDITKFPVKLISDTRESLYAGYVLCCGGLYSDHLATLSGGSTNPPIIPIRGEYLMLKKEKQDLVKGNIYPVPDARFPFLGVHFTPRMDGSIWIGPNAILATSREGYSYSDVNVKEFVDTVKYKGFQKLAFKYYDFGINEFLRSMIPSLILKDLKQYIPVIEKDDIIRGPSGVRAQAVNEGGDLIEDFVFDEASTDPSASNTLNARILHCRNAPSPAATSSLSIARILAAKMFKLIGNS